MLYRLPCLLGLLLAMLAALSAPSAALAEVKVEVVGTEFRIFAPHGGVLTGEALVGAVLTITDRNGHRQRIRIDAVQRDPGDGEIVLYALSVPASGTDAWINACAPGPDGLALGFPLRGNWNETGEYRTSGRPFSLTCTAGAIGKCVRGGYKPWKTAGDGVSLAPYLQACTRMFRADYCGDGVSRTRNGTPINIHDRIGIQKRDDAPAMRFEAAWGPNGAVVVNHTRLPDVASVADILRSCPDRLAGMTGPNWTEDAASDLPEALILNESHVYPDDSL